jgi:very-short-patch-repair endonuclease
MARGVYLEAGGDRFDLENRCRAALAIAPRGALVCGPTALALMLREAPQQLGQLARGPVHLLVPHASTASPRRPGIAAHRRTQMPRPWRAGRSRIPTASPADSWAQVTSMLVGADPWRPGQPVRRAAPGTFRHPSKARFLACVQMADALMRRKKPILEAERFEAEVAQLPGRRGVRAVRDGFAWARARTDSLPETQLRLVLADGGLPEPVVNHGLTVEGRDKFLDLAWPGLKAAVEYDGRHHTTEPVQVEDDIRRRAAIHAAGWVTIEVLWEDVLAPTSLIARVRALIEGRAAA